MFVLTSGGTESCNLESWMDIELMTRHGTSLSLGWVLCSVRAGTQKSLGSASLKEDPEGVTREGAVLESGDAFSCWPSRVRACGEWGTGWWLLCKRHRHSRRTLGMQIH